MTANDEDLAERIRMLAFHGSRDKTCVRLRRLQLAPGRAPGCVPARLPRASTSGRAAGARPPLGTPKLGLGDLVELPEDEPGHVYHLIVSRSRERDRICEALSAADIASATYYVTPLPPARASLPRLPAGLAAETERAAAENFSVPLWPGIASEIQERVVETVVRPSA